LWNFDVCPEGGIETASTWPQGLRRILGFRAEQVTGETGEYYIVRGCSIMHLNEHYFHQIEEEEMKAAFCTYE
jgi:hypothetical protein